MDIKIKITTKDGYEFETKTASMALLQWYVKNIKKSGESIVAVFGPYHETFVKNILTAIQNKFGKFCQFPLQCLDENWYKEGLPDNKYDQDVIFEQSLCNEKVDLYESWCLSVLYWLKRNKDLTKLEFIENF